MERHAAAHTSGRAEHRDAQVIDAAARAHVRGAATERAVQTDFRRLIRTFCGAGKCAASDALRLRASGC